MVRHAGRLLAPAVVCAVSLAAGFAAQAQQIPTLAPREDAETEPGQLVRGGWVFTAAGQTDLTFTDNAYLTRTNRTSDFIFTPTAILDARETSSKSVFDAKLVMAYDAYAKATDLSGFRIQALTDGTVRFADDTFKVRGRLATNLQPSNFLGVMPATQRTIGGNQVQVLNYGIAPSLDRPVNDRMDVQASYDYAGVTFLRPPSGGTRVGANNTSWHKARTALVSSRGAGPVTWGLEGAYERRDAGRMPTAERARGQANTSYQVSSPFALTARGGYEWIDEPTLSSNLTGIYGFGGFMYRPSPRTSVRAEAGYRYRSPNYLAEIEYQRSRALILSASFSQGVETSQGFINDLYGRTRRDANGNLLDPDTGALPDPTTAPFNFTNQAFRYSRLRGGLHGTIGRNFYDAYGSYERRRAGTIAGDSWGGNVGLGRKVTRTITAKVEARYTRSTQPDFAVVNLAGATTKSASASLRYEITRTASAQLRYVHLNQSTRFIKMRENAGVLSLTKTF